MRNHDDGKEASQDVGARRRERLKEIAQSHGEVLIVIGIFSLPNFMHLNSRETEANVWTKYGSAEDLE
jgi:hypothetical protein